MTTFIHATCPNYNDLKTWAHNNVKPGFNDASPILWACRFLSDKNTRASKKDVKDLAKAIMPFIIEALNKPVQQNCTYIY